MQLKNFPAGPLRASLLMTNDEYHGDTTHISKSGLTKIKQSPRHYWSHYLDPEKEKKDATPALITGQVYHAAILEQADFENQYLVTPKFDLRTNVGKAAKAEFMASLKPGVRDCSQDDFDLARRMRDAVNAHPTARELFAKGHAELTYIYDMVIGKDEETGEDIVAPIKVRPDFENDMNLLVDLKGCGDARGRQFGNDAAKYSYDVQSPLYKDVITFARDGINAPQGFVFVAIEKEPPFAIGCYFVPNKIFESGRSKYAESARIYAGCKKKNEWPCYNEDVEQLWIPEWAYHEAHKTSY